MNHIWMIGSIFDAGADDLDLMGCTTDLALDYLDQLNYFDAGEPRLDDRLYI